MSATATSVIIMKMKNTIITITAISTPLSTEEGKYDTNIHCYYALEFNNRP